MCWRGMRRKSIIVYVLCPNAPPVRPQSGYERLVLDLRWRLVTGTEIPIRSPKERADQDDQALLW
jgi:hypothetical protein